MLCEFFLNVSVIIVVQTMRETELWEWITPGARPKICDLRLSLDFDLNVCRFGTHRLRVGVGGSPVGFVKQSTFCDVLIEYWVFANNTEI